MTAAAGYRPRGTPDLRRLVPVGLIAALTLAACTSGADREIELGEVTAGEVVETVAAPARIEPRGQQTVASPATGEVAELLVDDGDVVEAGDPVLRLESDSVELSIAQAEAAVEAAEALVSSAGAGVDLSPLIAVVREQLQATVPTLLEVLASQVDALPDGPAREQALTQLAQANANYAGAVQALHDAEQEAASSAAQASAGQRAAAEAQRTQAELALQAAEGRADDLVVMAPTDGIVELGRAGGTGASGVPGSTGSGGLGAGDVSGFDVGSLLGDAGSSSADAPLAVGAAVAAGQALFTVYDLGGFHAQVTVDEVDAVRVEAGQAAVVLVDAFPEAELTGKVEHVAVAPERGETGGVVFPVTVSIDDSDTTRLRVGLTASAEIEVGRVQADLVVPTAALFRRGGQEVVLVEREGVARQIPVDVLAIGADRAAVAGDLAVGDRIVVVGVEDLVDGDPL